MAESVINKSTRPQSTALPKMLRSVTLYMIVRMKLFEKCHLCEN